MKIKDSLAALLKEYVFPFSLFIWTILAVRPLPAFQFTDGFWLWMPRLNFAANELMRSSIPFWNEYKFCGSVFLSDGATNMLNPAFIFYFFMTPDWAYTVGTLLFFFILFFGAWAYFRGKGFSLPASMVATLGYSFGGQILFWSLYHGMDMVFAFFPWILVFFAKYEATARIRWKFFAFILLFLSFLGGFFQFALLAGISLIVEGVGSFQILKYRKIVWDRFVTFLLAFLSGMITILPTFQAIDFSHRRLVPYFVGLLPNFVNHFKMIFFGSSLGYHSYPNYFYFIGLILLALALYAVRKSAKLLRNPFYLYSFSFPLFLTAVLLNIIPTSFQLGIASDPFRGMFIFILTVSSLAASGTDMFLKSLGTRKRFYLPVELFVAGVISFVVCFSTDISDGFVSARNFIFILGLLIFINLALELLIRKKGLNFAKFIFPVWIVALACINCLPNSWNYLKTNVLHDSTTLVDKWRNQGLDIKELSGEWRVMHLGPDGDIFKGLLEQWADYYRIRSIGAYGEFYPKTVFMRIRDDGLITNPYNAATHYKNNTITDPDLLSKYGVLYLISDNSYERKPKEKEWQLLKKFEDISVYKNPKYIGRSYIVDKEGKIVKGAQILEDKNSYIKISVNANAGDTLILADSWFPGWTCYDNGKKAPGFDDRGFRGRNIESDGDHIIEWVYKPKLFYIGAFISFGGIFIFILLCLVELILRKLKSNRRRGL